MRASTSLFRALKQGFAVAELAKGKAVQQVSGMAQDGIARGACVFWY